MKAVQAIRDTGTVVLVLFYRLCLCNPFLHNATQLQSATTLISGVNRHFSFLHCSQPLAECVANPGGCGLSLKFHYNSGTCF